MTARPSIPSAYLSESGRAAVDQRSAEIKAALAHRRSVRLIEDMARRVRSTGPALIPVGEAQDSDFGAFEAAV